MKIDRKVRLKSSHALSHGTRLLLLNVTVRHEIHANLMRQIIYLQISKIKRKKRNMYYKLMRIIILTDSTIKWTHVINDV